VWTESALRKVPADLLLLVSDHFVKPTFLPQRVSLEEVVSVGKQVSFFLSQDGLKSALNVYFLTILRLFLSEGLLTSLSLTI